MGQNFHKIEAVKLEGGDPPPSGQPDRFFTGFFLTPSLMLGVNKKNYRNPSMKFLSMGYLWYCIFEWSRQ